MGRDHVRRWRPPAPRMLGTGANDGDWFKTKAGELVVMSIGDDGKLTVKARAPLGGLPEGIAYSANSEYLYVGNYFDKDLQVFRFANGKLTEAGPRLKLPGQPASVRGRAW